MATVTAPSRIRIRLAAALRLAITIFGLQPRSAGGPCCWPASGQPGSPAARRSAPRSVKARCSSLVCVPLDQPSSTGVCATRTQGTSEIERDRTSVSTPADEIVQNRGRKIQFSLASASGTPAGHSPRARQTGTMRLFCATAWSDFLRRTPSDVTESGDRTKKKGIRSLYRPGRSPA